MHGKETYVILHPNVLGNVIKITQNVCAYEDSCSI